MSDRVENNPAMQVAAQTLDDFFNGRQRPRRIGFALFVFPTNMPRGARTNYVSNCNRADMIAALKEVLARFEGRVPEQSETVQ